jgi:hypothetical protein
MKAMRPSDLLQRRTPRRHRRRVDVSSESSMLLGTAVKAVVPLQSRNPGVVLAASLAELAALVVLVASASLAGLALLVAASLVLVVLSATNRHQVLALTSKGHVALAASPKGRPRTIIGPVPRALTLPEPAGFGQPIDIAGATWWVDRSAFRYLRHARALLEADREDHGGEGEDHRGQHRDPVEVALHDRRSRGRRPQAPAEHLRQPAAAPAVQEDQHDEGA